MNETHPLDATITRINQSLGYLGLKRTVDQQAHWVSTVQLVAPTSPHLAAMRRNIHTKFGTQATNTVASILLQDFDWRIITMALAAYLFDQRVLDLQPAQVVVRLNKAHQIEGIALLSSRFTALSTDRAADHADATVVPDQDALRDALGRTLHAHFDATISCLVAATGCKPHVLWLNIADSYARTLIYLMTQFDDSCTVEQIGREIEQGSFVDELWLRNRRPVMQMVEYNGHQRAYLDRVTCCQYYRHSDIFCGTCPRLSETERRERQLAWLVKQVDGGV